MRYSFYPSHDLYHDFLKFLVCMWANKNDYYFETEDKAEQDRILNPFRPDVVLRRKKKNNQKHNIVYVEIQFNVNPNWLQKTMANYEGKNLIIIEIEKYIILKNVHSANLVKELYNMISIQLDIETNKGKPMNNTYKKKYECICGFKGNKYPHYYNCKTRKRLG